jgi:hypothetical protein
MKQGCLAISGLGLTSLFFFGVTLEAVNDPKQLSAIPFTFRDFITCGLIALAILMLVRLTRKRDPRKTLTGKWRSYMTRDSTRYRTALTLDPDGSAEIRTKAKSRDSKHALHTNAHWQLLNDGTLHLLGTQTITCRILRLSSWTMTTADPAESGNSVRWIKHPRINTKAFLLVAAAIFLPVIIALSLPRSGSAHEIAEDPQFVPPSTSGP